MYTFGPGVNGYHFGVGHQVFAKQLRDAETLLEKGRSVKRALANPNEVRRYVQKQRRFFLEAIGGLPGERCDLQARLTGTFRRPGYRIEKVIFQSLPQYYVTANLFLPEGAKGKVPAVLVPSGHTFNGKAGYQAYGALLAKNGLAALVTDPVGQGERFQLIDRSTGAQIVQWGTTEHSFVGLACTLSGQNIARYFIWDLVRAVDYLQSRPEIDPARIGCSGTSGGGTQTCYLMMVDDRISAAAPSCYVTERLAYMKHFHAHDAEQNLFGHIPAGFNYDDFIIALAPKPVLLLGVEYDFFPIEGLLATYEEARRVYGVFGAEDNCRIFLDRTIHGLTAAHRRTGMGFFAEVLGGRRPAELNLEEDAELSDEELRCTKSGQVLIDYPDAPNVMERIVSQILSRPEPRAGDIIERVRRLVCARRENGPLYPRVISTEVDIHQWHIERLFFSSERDITLTAVFVKPAGIAGRIAVTVVVGRDITGQAGDDGIMARLRDLWVGGSGLLFLDLRASGAVSPIEAAATHFTADPLFKLACNAWMLGDNLVCQRAYDVLRGFEFLRSRDDVDGQRISLWAADEMALPGLLAAIADGQIVKARFAGLPASYAEELGKVYYDREILNERTAIHGMLSWFDVPELLTALSTACAVERELQAMPAVT